jgi:hypothetical protein
VLGVRFLRFSYAFYVFLRNSLVGDPSGDITPFALIFLPEAEKEYFRRLIR